MSEEDVGQFALAVGLVLVVALLTFDVVQVGVAPAVGYRMMLMILEGADLLIKSINKYINRN